MKVWNSGTKKDENNIWKYLIPDFYSNRLFAALFLLFINRKMNYRMLNLRLKFFNKKLCIKFEAKVV